MTDIFFSYSSKDRARAQPVRDALVDRGFAVFWDQEVPTGIDWDTWIRQHLTDARCVILLWSVHSILSDNVRHEAVIARQQSKLVPVLLDEIAADRFPMGLYSMQAANLCSWDGDLNAAEWSKLLNQIESKLTPAWVRRTLDSMEAELVAERSRRETAERRDRTFRDQIAKEADARQQLRAELDQVLEQIAEYQRRGDLAGQERQQLRAERDDALEQVAQHRRRADLAGEERQQLRTELDSALEELAQHQQRADLAGEERIAADGRIRSLTLQLDKTQEQVASLSEKSRDKQRGGSQTAKAGKELPVLRDGARATTGLTDDAAATTLRTARDSPAPDLNFDERWQQFQERSTSRIPILMIGIVITLVVGLLIILTSVGGSAQP